MKSFGFAGLLYVLGVCAGIHPAQATIPTAPSAIPSAAAHVGNFQNIGGFDSITTDDIQYNLNTGSFTLKNHFTATRGATDITADRATGNSREKQLTAIGNVVVHQHGPLPGHPASVQVADRVSTLTCDHLDVDGQHKQYVATGHVHYVQDGGRDATSDRGTLDDTTHMLHLTGHVHIKDTDRYLDADDVLYNTLSGDVNARGNVIVRAPAPSPAPHVSSAPSSRGKHRPRL